MFVLKVGVVVALAGLLAGPVDRRTPIRVLHPTSSVAVGRADRVVADGRRAAAVSRCGIVVWHAGARKASAPREVCRLAHSAEDMALSGVALAGDRVAWIQREWSAHGTHLWTELFVKAGTRRARLVADAYDEGGFGSELLRLAGDGGALALQSDAYDVDTDEIVDRAFLVARTRSATGTSACPRESDGAPARLCVRIQVNGTSLAVESVSGRRVLVDADGRRYVVTRGGSTATSITRGGVAALDGTTVVVIRPRKLEVWDSSRDELLSTFSVPALARPASSLTLAGGLAVYSSNGIHLVRLTDGRQLKLQIPRGERPIAAAIEPAGLFVLYRVGRHERLGFVPLSRLGGIRS